MSSKSEGHDILITTCTINFRALLLHVNPNADYLYQWLRLTAALRDTSPKRNGVLTKQGAWL